MRSMHPSEPPLLLLQSPPLIMIMRWGRKKKKAQTAAGRKVAFMRLSRSSSPCSGLSRTKFWVTARDDLPWRRKKEANEQKEKQNINNGRTTTSEGRDAERHARVFHPVGRGTRSRQGGRHSPYVPRVASVFLLLGQRAQRRLTVVRFLQEDHFHAQRFLENKPPQQQKKQQTQPAMSQSDCPGGWTLLCW